ncbi:DNA-binding transcriptional regulator, LysR family [Pseudoalteromonas denitrificans DSM 6059]|uniref:DNA-binding transcriptional regulator, LysR family n=2 Tax=Pseudoalteromonas TaxID=53246 RepID=A0A1I1NBM5_9GAMM|nr:DNA-binding transcriptional regulator, LysR family [Pseudoalteromonas denitrificans DSM 6059]
MLVFDEVVKKGSFTLAADALGHTKSAVSQYITQLESALEVRLLNRSTRTLILTAAGQLLAKRSDQLVDLLSTTIAEVASHHNAPSGRIGITAPHAFETSLVTPIIADLCIEYPKLIPELIFTDERLDILENKLDMAISVGPQKDSNYNAILIGVLDSILVGSPQYIAKIGVFQPNNLSDYNLVTLPWQKQCMLNNNLGKSIQFESNKLLKVNTTTSAINSIKCGVGIGLVPSIFVKNELDSGLLVRVLPEFEGEQRNVYAIHSYQQQLPLVLRRFVDKLKSEFKEKHALDVC